MKKFLLPLSVCALLFSGCGSNNKENSPDHGDATHSHDNNEDHTHHDTVSQEEFTGTTDTVQAAKENHSHEEGHDHKH